MTRGEAPLQERGSSGEPPSNVSLHCPANCKSFWRAKSNSSTGQRRRAEPCGQLSRVFANGRGYGEDLVSQWLRLCVAQSLWQCVTFEKARVVVGDQVPSGPRRIGSEPLPGNHSRRQFVLDHIVRALIRSRLLPMPTPGSWTCLPFLLLQGATARPPGLPSSHQPLYVTPDLNDAGIQLTARLEGKSQLLCVAPERLPQCVSVECTRFSNTDSRIPTSCRSCGQVNGCRERPSSPPGPSSRKRSIHLQAVLPLIP